MEEKNGRIVEIVESTEVQKQQKNSKRNLRIMIASLILAGSMGYGAMNLSQGDSKEGQPVVNVNTDYHISSDLNGIEISNISTAQDSIEVTKSNPALYAVVTAKDGETADISYILTADDSNVKLEDDQQLVLVENYTEDELNSSFLYQKEQRQVSTDEQGTLTQAGEWQTTDDYIIRNDAPRNSVATRYVFKGTLSTVLENSPVVELPHVMLDNSELNVTTQDTLTDEQKVTLSQQAQNTIKSIYDDKFNSLQDYQESVQPNQPSFPSIQTTTSDERQQFLDKINQKITEMNQMLDNTNVNEQSNEGKTR